MSTQQKTGLEMFDNDSLAWLVWHFEQDPANEPAARERTPDFPDRVREEFAKREARAGTKLLPKHLRRPTKRA